MAVCYSFFFFYVVLLFHVVRVSYAFFLPMNSVFVCQCFRLSAIYWQWMCVIFYTTSKSSWCVHSLGCVNINKENQYVSYIIMFGFIIMIIIIIIFFWTYQDETRMLKVLLKFKRRDVPVACLYVFACYADIYLFSWWWMEEVSCVKQRGDDDDDEWKKTCTCVYVLFSDEMISFSSLESLFPLFWFCVCVCVFASTQKRKHWVISIVMENERNLSFFF